MPHLPATSPENSVPTGAHHARTVALLAGLVIVALTYFVLYPSLQRIRTISTAMAETKTDLANKNNNDYSLPKLLETYRRYEPAVDELERSVRTRSRELEFITTLEALAEHNNLAQEIQIGAYEALEDFPYYRMPLQLELTGSFNDIVTYLQGIERLNSYVIITQLTLNNPANTPNARPVAAETTATQAQPLTASIIADTFWQ